MAVTSMPPKNKLVETVVAVASGSLSKADLTLFFRRWTKKGTGKMM